MYTVITYVSSTGKDAIAELIQELSAKADKDKNARINLNKIMQYLDYLEKYGKDVARVNKNIGKHIDGEIWEIRPIDNRVLFAVIEDDTIILLHHFIKKTQKTPKKEIEQAKRNLNDWKSRR